MYANEGGFFIRCLLTNIYPKVFFIGAASTSKSHGDTDDKVMLYFDNLSGENEKGEWWSTSENVAEESWISRPIFYKHIRVKLLQFFKLRHIRSYQFEEQPRQNSFECIFYLPTEMTRDLNFFYLIDQIQLEAPLVEARIALCNKDFELCVWHQVSTLQLRFLLKQYEVIPDGPDRQALLTLLLRHSFDFYRQLLVIYNIFGIYSPSCHTLFLFSQDLKELRIRRRI